jgi:L-fucose mutarotase
LCEFTYVQRTNRYILTLTHVCLQTPTGKLVVLAGCNAPETLDAIASVLPIDGFVDTPLFHMSPSPGVALPPEGAEVHSLSQTAIGAHSSIKLSPLERFAFYGEARKAFAVVQTSERRPYGCFLLQKGVVGPDGKDLLPAASASPSDPEETPSKKRARV